MNYLIWENGQELNQVACVLMVQCIHLHTVIQDLIVKKYKVLSQLTPINGKDFHIVPREVNMLKDHLNANLHKFNVQVIYAHLV